MADMVRPEEALERTIEPPPIKSGEWTKFREAKGLGKAKPVKDKVESAQRRLRMAMMAADGATIEKIAIATGLAKSTVSAQIEALVVEYHERSVQAMGRRVAREVAIIDMVAMEATLAWFESKEGKVTNVKKRAREIKSVLVKGRNTNTIGHAKPNVSEQEARNRIDEDLVALFAEDGPKPPTPVVYTPDGQTLQIPTENEEETERTETSPGDPRFLQIILDCHQMRAKLMGLYKQDDEGRGADAYTALSPEQRRLRLAALVQDLRAAKAIHEGQQNQIATQEVSHGAVIDVTPTPRPATRVFRRATPSAS